MELGRLPLVIDEIHRCGSIPALKNEYEIACETYADDPAAMWAIREATFYVKERLEALELEKKSGDGESKSSTR
jgi:hypothetical protein